MTCMRSRNHNKSARNKQQVKKVVKTPKSPFHGFRSVRWNRCAFGFSLEHTTCVRSDNHNKEFRSKKQVKVVLESSFHFSGGFNMYLALRDLTLFCSNENPNARRFHRPDLKPWKGDLVSPEPFSLVFYFWNLRYGCYWLRDFMRVRFSNENPNARRFHRPDLNLHVLQS